MKTKTTVLQPVQKVRVYPCLMVVNDANSIAHGMLVLMCSATGERGQGSGVVVDKANSHCQIGKYDTNWNMQVFEPLPAGSSVTLTQD